MADSDAGSSERGDEDWRDRAWRSTVTKMACKHPYDRRRVPYKQFVPQVPFYMHLAQSLKPSAKTALKIRLPDTIVFGLGPDPGSGGLTQAWLYNSPDGYVCRREKFTDADILARFQSPEPRAIVAVMKRPILTGGIGSEHVP